MSPNRFGLDADYFQKNLELLARDAANYSAEDMTRALDRLHQVALYQSVGLPTPPPDSEPILDSSEPMWDWFGLSYSAYLVLPRVLLCGMPIAWQRTFVALLEQATETYDSDKINDNYTVLLRDENNRFVKDPYRHYRHFPRSELPFREKPAGADGE
ncbi:hypothetical protein HPT27_10415 [Permianibacter sp. IMCC34836]|uniref:hypothetical protein n=1 Tax=Permianibacter fluminis TaxID=2738515 RepID=UPI001556677D|nr:hypothetical protein [Permianibacter fluminis]NQD37442.1 hypothetical protein [Permianibacter fluminis]